MLRSPPSQSILVALESSMSVVWGKSRGHGIQYKLTSSYMQPIVGYRQVSHGWQQAVQGGMHPRP